MQMKSLFAYHHLWTADGRNFILMPWRQKVAGIGRWNAFCARNGLFSLMPHTNVLSQTKRPYDNVLYRPFRGYWIHCTVLFYSMFNKSVAKIYTRYECRKVLSHCATVLGPFTVLLRRKYEINAWIGFGSFVKFCMGGGVCLNPPDTLYFPATAL